MLRLDKYLADAGLGTRSEVKRHIRSGLVTVSGRVVRESDRKLDPETDVVCFRGEPVERAAAACYLFHKPSGCVTARTDRKEQTVMDFFPERLRGLSPVGRLDKDTEGLLLVTDDGALNHRLTSPAHHVKKTYYAVLDRPVPEDARERFAQGIGIGDEKPARPAKLTVLPDAADHACPVAGTAYALLTVTEGRYHQVKRMFAAVGCKVVYLKRLTFGTLSLGDLPRGSFRRLSEEELDILRASLKG